MYDSLLMARRQSCNAPKTGVMDVARQTLKKRTHYHTTLGGRYSHDTMGAGTIDQGSHRISVYIHEVPSHPMQYARSRSGITKYTQAPRSKPYQFTAACVSKAELALLYGRPAIQRSFTMTQLNITSARRS